MGVWNRDSDVIVSNSTQRRKSLLGFPLLFSHVQVVASTNPIERSRNLLPFSLFKLFQVLSPVRIRFEACFNAKCWIKLRTGEEEGVDFVDCLVRTLIERFSDHPFVLRKDPEISFPLCYFIIFYQLGSSHILERNKWLKIINYQ